MRGKIVNLVRLNILNTADQAGEVIHIAVQQCDVLINAQPAQPVVGNAKMRGAAHYAKNFIAFTQKIFGQIGSILTGNAGDQGALGHKKLSV